MYASVTPDVVNSQKPQPLSRIPKPTTLIRLVYQTK